MKYKYFMLKRLAFTLILIFSFQGSHIFSEHNLTQDHLIGKVTEIVKCENNSEETYAVYVPTSYTIEKRWPVIIAFEPTARGSIPVKLFKNSAERYGYIVVCSNNSQNGPWKDVIRSMKSVWIDIQKRFSVDKARIYTTGFSGGSRAASLFESIIGVAPAGIIACGAGLQEKLHPSRIKRSFYYGIIGLEDFNYKEFRKLVPELEKAGVRYCIDYVSGIHKWPEESAIARAVEWMEIDAVVRDATKEDKSQTEKIYLNLQDYANILLKKENFYYGVLYLGSIARHFRMIRPVDDLEEKVSEMMIEKKYIRFKKADDLKNRKEYQFISVFKKVFNRIKRGQKSRLGLQTVLNDLKIPFLKSERKNKKRIYDGFMATRLLYEIAIKANWISSDFQKKKDKKMSVLFAQIAVETKTRVLTDNYQLASVYAVFGNKKKCIKIIKRLLNGEKNLLDYVEKDPDFNEMLKDPDFMSILINK